MSKLNFSHQAAIYQNAALSFRDLVPSGTEIVAGVQGIYLTRSFFTRAQIFSIYERCKFMNLNFIISCRKNQVEIIISEDINHEIYKPWPKQK